MCSSLPRNNGNKLLHTYVMHRYLGGVFLDFLKRAFFGAAWFIDTAKFGDVPSAGALWFLLALFWASISYIIIILKVKSFFTRIVIVTLLFILSVVTIKYIRLPFSLQQGGCALLYVAIGHYINEKDLLERIYSIPLLLRIAIFVSWLPAIYFGGVSMGECNYMGKLLPVTLWGTLAGTYCFVGLIKWIGDKKYPMTTNTLSIMLAQAFLQFFQYYNEDYFHISISYTTELIILFAGSFLLSFPFKFALEKIPKVYL